MSGALEHYLLSILRYPERHTFIPRGLLPISLDRPWNCTPTVSGGVWAVPKSVGHTSSSVHTIGAPRSAMTVVPPCIGNCNKRLRSN